MSKTIWDFDRIRTFSNQLNDCTQTLQAQMKHLQLLQSQASGSWVSEAGQLYESRLQEDLDAIAKALQTFETIQKHLEQAVQTYAGSELETINRLNQQFYSQLSVR